MARCLICNHEHAVKNQDPISCGVCKMCGMVLCGKRMTVRSAGRVYAFCCARCRNTHKRMSAAMKRKLRRGEITEKEFQEFDRDVVI
jgi:hypothetical protein